MTLKKYILTKKGETNLFMYNDFEKTFHQYYTETSFREKINGALGRQNERFSHVYDINNTAMILIKRFGEGKENLQLIGDEKNFENIEREIKLKGFSLEESLKEEDPMTKALRSLVD